MLKHFGGGIELTTLAAIPSGSGLGTSSIMGAVLMAVIHRMIGGRLSPQELFHGVLQLEQELTTGGGWQDQIGGAVEGVKMITRSRGSSRPENPFRPPGRADPAMNGGQTLLYYTGIRRLAKNILRSSSAITSTAIAGPWRRCGNSTPFRPPWQTPCPAKDIRAFGELIDLAWDLNKAIDPDSTTDVIEGILARIKPHIHGAKLLGAGGGGFLLIVCRSRGGRRGRADGPRIGTPQRPGPVLQLRDELRRPNRHRLLVEKSAALSGQTYSFDPNKPNRKVVKK